MKNINLMTITLYMRIFYKFNLDHDKEDLQDGYEEIMDMVQNAGYEAVDVTSMETAVLGADYVREVLERHQLRAGSYIYFGQFAAMDEEGMENRVNQAKQGVNIACSLGTDIYMLAPQASPDIADCTPQQIRDRMIQHWIRIVPYAKEKGLHVVVEDTPDLKLYFCKAEEVKEILDSVPGLELAYDSGNMILVGEDPIEFLDTFRDRIGYVHLKDMREAPAGSTAVDLAQDGTPMSSAPTGTGLINLHAVISKLVEIGYQGGMTVEFCVDDDGIYGKSLVRSRVYIEQLIG